MGKTFGKEAAEIVAAAFKATDNERARIIVKTTGRGEEVISLVIPEMLEKSIDFNKTLLDSGVLPSDIFKNKKTRKKLSKSCLTYIVFLKNNNITNKTEKELKALLNSLDQESKLVSDVAPFIWNVFVTWSKFHKKLRKNRDLTEEMVRGYLKLLGGYSHREILDMIETYGKWAEAHYAMVEAGEYKPVWFPNMPLGKLLISNRMASHLEGGWKALAIEKQIPEEYVKSHSDGLDPEIYQRKVEYYAKQYIEYYEVEEGHSLAARMEFKKYPGLEADVDARIKELQNAS